MANISIKEAQALRASWAKKVEVDPSLKCSHPQRNKEKYAGQDTGDRICTTCGDSKWHADL